MKHVALGSLLLLTSLACTGEITGVTRSRAARVPAEDGAVEVVVSPGSLVLYFDGEPPAYAPGDVVYGSESGGYLRRVVSVERLAHKLVLATEAAELGEAFDELRLRERVQVQPTATVVAPTFRRQVVELDGRSYTAEIRHDAPVARQDRSLSTSFVWEFPRLSITLTDPAGHVALELAADRLRVEKALTLDVEVDFAFFRLESFRFVTEDDTRTTIDGLSIAVTGALPSVEASIPVLEAPAMAVVPVGPLVFTVGASIDLGASLALAAAAEVHTTSQIGYASWSRRGISWHGEHEVIDESQLTVDADFGELEASVTPLDATAAVFVSGALRFALYGVAGPELFARVSPLVASLTFTDERVAARLSASASAGARFAFPFFDLSALSVSFGPWNHDYGTFEYTYPSKMAVTR